MTSASAHPRPATPLRPRGGGLRSGMLGLRGGMVSMLLVHIGLFLAAWFASFLTRWDFQPDARMMAMFRATVGWVVVVKTIVFLLHEQFRWRLGRLSFADLGRLAFTTTLATLTLVAVDVAIAHEIVFPLLLPAQLQGQG